MKQAKNRTVVNILLSAVVLFVIAFFLFYGKSDLFRFPFDASVWGTASDWVMICVTIVTAVFLIKSFKEQRKSNEIAYKTFLSTIIPVFSAEADYNEIDENPFSNIKITQRKNAAYELSFPYYNEKFIHEPLHYKRNTTYYPGDSYSFSLRHKPANGFIAHIKVASISFKDKENVHIPKSRYRSPCLILSPI